MKNEKVKKNTFCFVRKGVEMQWFTFLDEKQLRKKKKRNLEVPG